MIYNSSAWSQSSPSVTDSNFNLFLSLTATANTYAKTIIDGDKAVLAGDAAVVGDDTVRAVGTGEKSKMYVKWSSNVDSKRVFDNRHYCLHCCKSSTNLTKHLLNKHKNEERIKHIMMEPKKSENRTHLLEMVRNLGDYQHNCEVRRRGEGEIVP